ncbi:MAG TPA: pseudouridine synthase [Pirellulaceae bacterium]|nr:pseudouridine synthase [Pirellulaceae bacterium]
MAGEPQRTFHLVAEHDGLTLAAALKRLAPKLSWSQARKLLAGRRVQVNGNLCLDEERKVKAGDVVRLSSHALAPPATADDVKLVYVDEHLVVVQKPAGVTTLRHREETDLPQRRKQLQPTLDELLPRLLARHLGLRYTTPTRQGGERHRGRSLQRDVRLALHPVHRLDRDTSGLLVFARTRGAEEKLIHMFARHQVQRAYVAVVQGRIDRERTIESWLVRDRGDGLRGSSPLGEAAEGAQRAVTHVRPMEQLANCSVVECRLETGRTHQIRIHLSEAGHPLCGEKTYTHAPGEPARADASGAPRQALHSAELALSHPISGQALRFRMALPADLKQWLLRMR